jgi:hypothetical protein
MVFETIKIKEIDELGFIEWYSITPVLRYAKKEVDGKTELRLQQMWRGSNGSEKVTGFCAVRSSPSGSAVS